MWYWRQAVGGIAVSFFREIRTHKWLAARALLTGWGIWIVFAMSIPALVTPYFLGGNALGIDIDLRHPIGMAWALLWEPVFIPATMNLLRPSPFSFVFSFALSLIAWSIVGWVVARADFGFDPGSNSSAGLSLVVRLNRDLVLQFAGSILLMHLLGIGPYIHFTGPPAYPLIGPLAVNAAISVLGILLGGGILRDRSATLSKGDFNETASRHK